LLRVLGVPQETVMRDYMESKQHALEARKNQLLLLRVFKGEEAADKLAIMMGVEEAWLRAAFAEIDAQWGSFDNYIREGLQLSDGDIAQLQNQLLE
jgi:protein-tyrosine phosphatase